MPTITRLVQGKRDPTRVNIFVDGKFLLALSADLVLSHGLTRGDVLSPSALASLQSLAAQEKLFAKLINFLSYRPRSEKELRDRASRYFPPGSILPLDDVINKLKALGYLNDLEFARWFANSRMKNRPRSTRHLAAELYAKGIDKSVIQTVLTEFGNDRQAIRSLIAKKSTLSRDKLIAYLARRGFPWEIIKEALDTSE